MLFSCFFTLSNRPSGSYITISQHFRLPDHAAGRRRAPFLAGGDHGDVIDIVGRRHTAIDGQREFTEHIVGTRFDG